MVVPHVVIIEYILMNDKLYGFPIHIEYCRYSFIITIMCDLELAIVVIQHQNMGDALLIKLYLTIPFKLYLWVVLIHSPFTLTFIGLFLYIIVLQVSYCKIG